eukprot:10198519-Lingulodinium_polyedra.AAC.1
MECVGRAMCEPLQQQTVDLAASFCAVFETARNDAVESTICRRCGSQIARVARSMRTRLLALAAWSVRG